MKHELKRLLSFDEALGKVLAESSRHILDSEGCEVSESLNRVLREDVYAPSDVPQADNSAMDGYCVKHSDVASAKPDKPIQLPICGYIDAGHPLESLSAGSAAYIATGGMLPAGADCVIKIEDIEKSHTGNEILVKSAPPLGTYIRLKGKDFKKGEKVVSSGEVISPFLMGVLASQGLPTFRVSRRPRVAVITSGDEIVMPFEDPKPWQVRNANSYILSGQIAQAGGIPMDFGIMPDDPKQAEKAIQRALQLCDLVVTSGGISMGNRDPFIAALRNLNAEEIVHEVAIKPGKPFYFGTLDGKPIFGLPGNQASSAVTFELFVRPFLTRIQSWKNPDRLSIWLPLKEASVNKTDRDHFARARIVSKSGRTYAEPLENQASHMLTSLIGVQLLVRHAARIPRLDAEQIVECKLIM